MELNFQILGRIAAIELIAAGHGIRELTRLRNFYGGKNWRKMKGIATVRLQDGTIFKAELHWYEAHGIGRQEMKLKRLLEQES
jgi:hypothetical protein